MSKLKKFFHVNLLLGILIGSALGYGYYHFVGCSSGACAITSSPVSSTLYGALFGIVLTFGPSKKKTTNE